MLKSSPPRSSTTSLNYGWLRNPDLGWLKAYFFLEINIRINHMSTGATRMTRSHRPARFLQWLDRRLSAWDGIHENYREKSSTLW